MVGRPTSALDRRRRLSTVARSAKVDHDQLRAIRRRLREGHQKLFDLHGEQIAGLQEALTALSRSHDEMVALMQADNDLEDLTDTHGLT
jgi:transposase-like protein